MKRRVAALFLVAFTCVPLAGALANDLPEILAGPNNRVPDCVTPGRLMAYLQARNPDLDERFSGIASAYMFHGERLGLRWDYAFFQMIIETGSLTFRRGHRAGDVKPKQNNFAGLGATGRGEPGESFKDIDTGVRAHLEHVLLYAGHPVKEPVAERTRKVMEWGVLTDWHKSMKHPITYADLASKWAPGVRSYAQMLSSVAERFHEQHCNEPDPQPQLVQAVRANLKAAVAKVISPKSDAPPLAANADKPSGAQLARAAIEQGKAEGNEQRSALGAPGPQRPESEATEPAKAAATAPTPRMPTPDKPPAVQTASIGAGAKALALPPPAPGQKCRVWTASYGGQKALIIRSVTNDITNYTVLDVNEGSEAREAAAFIAAYAKDGTITGEFPNQGQALEKAFELCPEG
jgi:hypothetical protein